MDLEAALPCCLGLDTDQGSFWNWRGLFGDVYTLDSTQDDAVAAAAAAAVVAAPAWWKYLPCLA
jgi:hypothetical protein